MSGSTETNWFVRHRQDWIDETIRVFRFINREHIERKFGISTPQASMDLQLFQAENPDVIYYNKSKKTVRGQYVTRPKRKNIPAKVKSAVINRQRGQCAECGCDFGPDDKIEMDHRPAIILRAVNVNGDDYHPPQNDPEFIEALHSACHLKRTVGRLPGAQRTITTKGSDAHLAAKFRKLEKPRKPRQTITPKGFGKIPSRPFDKQKRPFR